MCYICSEVVVKLCYSSDSAYPTGAPSNAWSVYREVLETISTA
ncbi:MAG: hypothetical protein WBA07_02570 [Rivularia sp. (in: cyanobacteria)]